MARADFVLAVRSAIFRIADLENKHEKRERIGSMGELTHFDSRGNAVMVDVTDKEITERVALAGGIIDLN